MFVSSTTESMSGGFCSLNVDGVNVGVEVESVQKRDSRPLTRNHCESHLETCKL